jgi:endoglucanase
MKLLVCAMTAASAFAVSPTTAIKVDQVGYLDTMPKLALIVARDAPREFLIRRTSSDAVAFRGALSAAADDPDSGDRVQTADFSKLTEPGKYYVEVPGVGRSWNFSIGPDVYSRGWYLAMRSYYGQRCGIAVDLGGEFPGFQHEACHLEGAWHPSSGKTGPRVSKGGWHDAGDYGRYIVNSGITTGTLLWAWELYGPRLREIKLNLPETGNGTPDMLNEIRWNLDWMMTMQDEDGGVWHKQTSERFSGFVMPEKDTLVSFVIGTGKEPFKSSCATGDFAAVMAIAGRVFQPFDARYAETALRAARRASDWLEKNPNVTFANPEGVGTGAYGDSNCADERLWAAAELYRSTGARPYQDQFLSLYPDFRKSIRVMGPQGWPNVANLGLWTYALSGAKDATAAAIRTDSLAAADEIVKRTAANGYRTSLISRDYVWGSNAIAANYGMQLLVADGFQPNAAYREAAAENLHYLLGRNTFSLSWVTQVGENPFRHPHHRPSGADNNAEPWPGLLSGGPNRGRQDDATRAKLPADLPPAKGYIDDQNAYSANETAINWNAPLVFLMAAQLPQPVGNSARNVK